MHLATLLFIVACNSDEEQKTQNQSTNDDVSQQLEDQQQMINDLVNKYDQLAQDNEDLRAELTTITGDIDLLALYAQVNENTQGIAANTTLINANATYIAQNSSQIDANTCEVSVIELSFQDRSIIDL